MQDEMDLGIDLMEYVRMVCRWLWLMILVAVLCGGLALGLSSLMPSVYQSEANVASVRSNTQITLSPDYRTLSESQLGLNAVDRQKALRAMALSNDIATAVAAELDSTFTAEERRIPALIGSVTVVFEGDLIRIQIQHRDPEKAAKLANTWARVYVDRVNELYAENPTSLEQILAQASQVFQSYQVAETALAQFAGANKISALTFEITARQNAISDNYAAQRNLERILQDARALQELASKGGTTDLGDRLATLMVRLNAFTASSTPIVSTGFTSVGLSSPNSTNTYTDMSVVVPGSTNISSPLFQLQLTDSFVGAGATANPRAQIDTLVAQLESRKKQVDAQIADPTLQNQILALQKELEQQNAKKQELTNARDLAWTTYKTLASKAEEVRVAQLASGTIVRLGSSASVPDQPISPRKLNNALIGAAVGFLFSLVIVFLFQFLDPKIRTAEDIVKHLALGTFDVRDSNDRTHTMRAPPASDYYRLWSRVFVTKQSNALLVIGAKDKGQSEAACQLATLAAQAGRSVIVVDANVNSPSVAKWFGVSNEHGWSELMSDNQANCAEYLQTTHVSNLRVLPSGSPVANLDEILVSPHLAETVRMIQTQADWVIYVAPPTLIVPDGLLLARQVESVCLFAVDGKTGRKELVELKNELQGVNPNLLGVILVHPSASTGWRGVLR